MRLFNQSIARCFLSAIIIVAATARVEADGARCSDLSEHESVLNEGQSFVHSGGGALSGGALRRDLRTFTEYRTPEFGDLDRYYSIELGEILLMSNIWSDEKIANIRLLTASDISSAEWHARIGEVAKRYPSAKEIYAKILTVKRSQRASTVGEINQTVKDIERVELAQRFQNVEANLSSNEAPGAFKRLVNSISGNEYLDVRTKYQLLKGTIQDVSLNSALTLLPSMKPALAEAKSQLNSYQMSLQCLDLADKLNSVGFKLEQQGLYAKAEKMFNEALMIRTKNLGNGDPATIAEYGELARLQSTQKHYKEAIALYERSLAEFRKLPAPGSEYASMLQTYADLLAQLKQTAKSDALYAEARDYYSKTKSNKS